MVCDTPPSQDASTHQIWGSYLKKYRRYARGMIILEMRSGQGHSAPKKICSTLQLKDAPTHQIWGSYLK